jgi:hypothetical protein
MDTFQITVLSVATIVLIGILIVVGMLMKKESQSVPFPPVFTDCPDGWETKGKMCIPNSANSGVFKGATEANFISDSLNNTNANKSKDFKKYTPGYAFCKSNGDGSATPVLLQNASEAQCNAITDAQKKQECLRCLSLPSGDRTNDGVLMTDELWAAGGKSARCAKKAWANRFGFTWDGVSNYNSC